MTDFEARLKHGLSADDEAFLKDLEGDVGIFQQMGATFSGPMKFWTAFAFVFSFAMFAGGVWAAFQMVGAETVKETVQWAVLVLALSFAVGMIKIWFWLRMNHLVVLKELKLIELQLVKG